VYGEPHTHVRSDMSELLRRLKPMSQAPWMLIGYFNEALWSIQHFQHENEQKRQMHDFLEVLDHCDVHDLGFTAVSWTFDNKQQSDRNMKVRLDWAVVSPSWSN
jgi:hypothetical protein